MLIPTRCLIIACLPWVVYGLDNYDGKPRRLDSVPKPTELSLPRSPAQHITTSRCYQESQTEQGPTVSPSGKVIPYGAGENVNYARDPSKPIGSVVWGYPGILLANGSTCCDSLSQVRDYIDYLDQTILDYLSIRQQFVVEAGRFKRSRHDVRSGPRALKVVQNAENDATKNGLAPWIANLTWTTTLNSFTELELCLFDENVKKKNYAPVHP